MSKLRAYSGQCVLITGAGSGIGQALALTLNEFGAIVVATDVDAAKLEQTRSRCVNADAIHTSILDVRNLADFRQVVEKTESTIRPIDILFNNAGIGIGGPTERYTDEAWQKTMDINIGGVVNGVQACYPKMLERSAGTIVNVASMAGLITPPRMAGYVMSKHAVVGLSLSLHVEAKPQGVSICALCPGFVQTDILEGGGSQGFSFTNSSEGRVKENASKTSPMRVDEFSRCALMALIKRPPIAVVPSKWSIAWMLQRFLPIEWTLWLMGRSLKRT